MAVTLLDPRYPCHPDRMVHLKADELMTDVRFERLCPACGRRWFIMRKARYFGSVRMDELEWIKPRNEPD